MSETSVNETTSRWTFEAAAAIAPGDARLPVLAHSSTRPAIADLDLWDMWQIADRRGRTLVRDGRQWWLFLAVPRRADPEARHDRARIHLLSHGAEGWRDHGPALPDGLSPGSREWSGSALLGDDGQTVTMFFTAAGDRTGGPHFRQRLFATRGELNVVDGMAGFSEWSTPVETVVADGRWYAPADQPAPVNGGIKGFRDPGFFHDPADGSDYLLFTGSAAAGEQPFDGVVGLACRDGDRWTALPPLVDASGTNSELERPHIVMAGGLYYLFWSTQNRRFAPGLDAPTGLYGMMADRLTGPWRPINGTGLVAGNPPEAPYQAYCWWVTGEGDVISFVDYPGTGDPQRATIEERRARFCGTPAPFFRLDFDGDRVTIAR